MVTSSFEQPTDKTLRKPLNVKFIVFSAIGVFNTLFDIALYALLRAHGFSFIVANVISVSAALVGSYLLNSRYTFKAKRWTVGRFAGFVTVTLFGLWVLQTIAIYALTPLIKVLPENVWQLLGGFEHTAKIIAPKLAATVITFIWNYLWYNKVIFKAVDLQADAELVSAELI